MRDIHTGHNPRVSIGKGKVETIKAGSIEVLGAGGGHITRFYVNEAVATVLAPYVSAGKSLNFYIEVEDD